jgi:alkanesulfonate monooxygenase SsuD/methylene tetrahydromethanopterin reductase-like flavin-dependent oxidoreductase (luciferase family)
MNPVLDASAITFGLIIPQRGALFGLGSLRELLEQGVRAEDSGQFDALWIGDALTSKNRPEAVACLSALAGMTERVMLAVGCMASFAVRDPALFALQWATLDQISGGRALLSVCNGFQAGGASAREGEHFGGIPDRERPARLEENIEILRALWSGEPVDFKGRFRRYSGIQILPTPVQDPCPIWMTANPAPGSSATRVLERVARYADGFQGSLGGAQWLTELRAALVEHGRDPDSFPIAGYHSINIGPDRHACVNDAITFFDRYYGKGFISPAAAHASTSAGTVEQCIDKIVELVEAGTTHIPIRVASLDQAPHWEPFVKEVLPGVREAIA